MEIEEQIRLVNAYLKSGGEKFQYTKEFLESEGNEMRKGSCLEKIAVIM